MNVNLNKKQAHIVLSSFLLEEQHGNLWRSSDVIVQHRLYLRNVQPSRSHIRGDQNADGRGFEGVQRSQPLFLLQLGVDAAAVEPQRAQQTVHSAGSLDAVDEHQTPSRMLIPKGNVR